MANIAPRAVEMASGGQFPTGCYVYQWPTVTEEDTPTLLEVLGVEDITFMAVGTWHGATAVLKGTLNPSLSAADHVQLQDLNGNNVSFTGDGLKKVQQTPLVSILPVISDGGANQSLDLYAFCYRAARR